MHCKIWGASTASSYIGRDIIRACAREHNKALFDHHLIVITNSSSFCCRLSSSNNASRNQLLDFLTNNWVLHMILKRLRILLCLLQDLDEEIELKLGVSEPRIPRCHKMWNPTCCMTGSCMIPATSGSLIARCSVSSSVSPSR